MNKYEKEQIADFFEKPSRERFYQILKNDIGERDCLDFKKEWITYPKLAKHMLAIANYGEGCIIIGVDERQNNKLNSIGIDKIRDKSEISSNLEKYLPSELSWEVLDLSFEGNLYGEISNKKFQIIFISYTPQYLPFVSRKDGEGIQKNTIYIRRGTRSETARYEEIQRIFKNKEVYMKENIEKMDLETHLEQLDVLYSNINKNFIIYENKDLPPLKSFTNLYSNTKTVPNRYYPTESKDEFIAKMIEKKKRKIENILGV